MNANPILGILGGLGPMSGVYFCELLTEHTRAERDSDHLDFLLSSHATTPDRTDFILGRSPQSPLPVMIDEVKRLIRGGAELIAIPCNTAHYFYESMQAASAVPMINIIEQTVAFCQREGIGTVGVLATEGTILSGAYEEVCRKAGLTYLTPTEEDQAIVSHIIYDEIKKGQPADTDAFLAVCDRLLARGCERLILGCTELSLLKKEASLAERFVDSLEVLACASIRLCGKEPVGFDDALMRFCPVGLPS